MKKDDDLRTIKELLEIVAHKVDIMEASRTGQSASFYVMKDQQSVMNKKLDTISNDLDEVKETQEDHTNRLEALSGDMEQVLTEIKATHDEIKKHLDLPIIPDVPES